MRLWLRSLWLVGAMIANGVAFGAEPQHVAAAHKVPENVVRNASAEEVEDGRPLHWGKYGGMGTAVIGAADGAHSGKRCAFLRLKSFGIWRGKPYANVGLLAGETNGYNGARAYDAEPNTAYAFTFWAKGDLPWVVVNVASWSARKAEPADREGLGASLPRFVPGREWRQYHGVFLTRERSKKFALRFHVYGFEGQGMRPGVLFVDDVSIRRIGPAKGASASERLKLPSRFNLIVRGETIAELKKGYESGDESVRRLIDRIMSGAERWAAKTDSWFLSRSPKETPLGMWTVACPFHPERVRDFSKDNFHWSIADPWRLVCPLCRAEGRKLYKYPNERYPDDGRGCYPSDEVWAQDHDAAWSKEHGGIPHDRWDGKPHGYSSAGYAYFFIGKCAHEIMCFTAQHVLRTLAEGYVLSKHIIADDKKRQAESRRFARKAKIVMLSLARSHLGDEYLADLFDMSLPDFYRLMRTFYAEDPEGLAATRFPGFVPYTLSDGVVGSPEHPARGGDIFGDGSWRGDLYRREWTRAYGLIRDSFDEREEVIRGMIERLLVAGEEDASALADTEIDKPLKVKKGKLDLSMRPYDMVVGGTNNLGGRELVAKFELGRFLNDPRIIDTVVTNVRYYLRNYFTGDGLGREGSCAYTTCAWSTMSAPIQAIYGYRGSYDASHPWWDQALKGLNPYRDPALKNAVAKFVLSAFPDGTMIPWMDSHVGCGIGRQYLEKVANDGGGLPREYERFYTIRRAPSGRASVIPQVDRLPSIVLHQSRKCIFRSGAGSRAALLSIDYSPNTGHWHPAPMDIVLFAHGHELAPDLGYFGAMSALTKTWIRRCEAHNTCLIRQADGSHECVHAMQGDAHRLLQIGGPIQVAEIVERDKADLTLVGNDCVYERTVALLRTLSEEHYAVDFFRVRGGALHDYYFHAQGRRCRAEGVTLRPSSQRKSLNEISGFTYEGGAGAGCGRIHGVRSGIAPGQFSLTWSDIPYWPTGKQTVVDRDIHLKLTMLPAPGTEVLVGTAPGQRRMSNLDLGEKLNVACIRRKNTAALDQFVGLVEPYRAAPFIHDVRRIEHEGGAPATVVLRVSLRGQTDWIVSNPSGTDCSAVIDGSQELRTDAVFSVASFTAGELVRAYLACGRRLQVGRHQFSVGPPYTGKLLAFDDERDVLTVSAQRPMPTSRRLFDQTIIIRHVRGTSTFTVRAIKHLGGNRYEIALRWTPHLGENYFRVVRAGGPYIWYQPPHSLPFRCAELGYHLYERLSHKRMRYLGRIITATSTTFLLDTENPNVDPGCEIVATRLRPGRDSFFIAQSLLVERRGMHDK